MPSAVVENEPLLRTGPPGVFSWPYSAAQARRGSVNSGAALGLSKLRLNQRHSSLVGRRKPPPLLALAHCKYSFTSNQLTPATGWACETTGALGVWAQPFSFTHRAQSAAVTSMGETLRIWPFAIFTGTMRSRSEASLGSPAQETTKAPMMMATAERSMILRLDRPRLGDLHHQVVIPLAVHFHMGRGPQHHSFNEVMVHISVDARLTEFVEGGTG